MRRKALKGVANTLCHMVDGDGRYPDDPRFAELGSGTLVVDALTGCSTHNGVGIEPALAVAGRMRDWLAVELQRLGLDRSSLLRATVTVPYQVEPILHAGMRLWALTFTCSSEVATVDVVYSGGPIPGRPEFGASVQR